MADRTGQSLYVLRALVHFCQRLQELLSVCRKLIGKGEAATDSSAFTSSTGSSEDDDIVRDTFTQRFSIYLLTSYVRMYVLLG